jgi:hypothetical protein
MRINRSTGQPVNGSTGQRLNGSTGQRINGSTGQPVNGSTRRLIGSRVAVACGVLTIGVAGTLIGSQRTASNMTTAANRFLEVLTPEQRQVAKLPLDSEDLTRWHYVPTNQFPRKGLAIKDMNEAQRKLAHDLLRTGLSQRGYTEATAIMELETVLKAIESAGGGRGGMNRDPELYFFTIFGNPSPKEPWGWRVNGHHLAVYFMVGNSTTVSSAPAFFGSNPAEVRDGPQKGLRIQAMEQDAGRALVDALDEAQRKTAIIEAAAPNDILTTTAAKADPLSPLGITAAAMTAPQRELLMKLIEVYTSQMTEDLAAERFAHVRKSGIEKIGFAWAGPIEAGQKHYYRVQGPTFLIEFDNTQNNGNHIHSVWRDFVGDYGRDLLREHLSAVRH